MVELGLYVTSMSSSFITFYTCTRRVVNNWKTLSQSCLSSRCKKNKKMEEYVGDQMCHSTKADSLGNIC